MTNESKKLEIRVSEVLKECGVPAHIRGYRYVRCAIIIAMENPNISMTKELYPRVANEFETTASRVERAIRHAVELAWERGNIDVLNEIFGHSVADKKGKTTNSEFIAMIADKLYLEDK